MTHMKIDLSRLGRMANWLTVGFVLGAILVILLGG